MEDGFLRRIDEALRRHPLLPERARVVVAVSGGADSVALLEVLRRLQPAHAWALHVAHLDHGLRKESAVDAEFVREVAGRWGIAATIERRDVRRVCAQAGWSLEDGARRTRYAFLRDVALRQGAGYLALAHTADDQAETVLMRLLRGTGLMGLRAMPVTRDLEGVWIVRPFLHVWRPEIEAYLKRARLTYREDATNRDGRFVRNRIRHQLLPLLEQEYNPKIKGLLAQLAEQSDGDYAYLQQATQRQWKRVAKVCAPSRVEISVEAFRRQPKALQRQVVRQAIQRLRGDIGQVEFRHWLEAERLFSERPVGTLVDLPGGIQFRRERAYVVCQRSAAAPVPALPD